MEYTGPVSSTLRQRFADSTTRNSSGCLEWGKACSNAGYGMVSIATGVTRGAHQVAWYLHYGVWPEQLVMHSCDNRRCCEISHLSLGAQADNLADASRKGRLPHGAGHHKATLGTAEVSQIREVRKQGWTLAAIAKHYHTSIATAHNICRGYTRAKG